jgi:peroxiredoxin
MNLSKIQRAGLFITAIFALITAFWIIFTVGLPNRAEFSGEYRDGIYIAPEIGAYAPEINQPTRVGNTVSLSALRGESVIINFWATWCVPCQTEMPELQSLHENTGGRILGVNIGESQESISTWVERFDLTFDIVLDPNGLIYSQYHVRGQPSTYVVDPDGIITHIFYGAVSSDSLYNALESHRING